MGKRRSLVLTCEHGGNRIPARYAGLFAGAERVLASHRGYDRGALPVARALSRRLRAPLVSSTVSRLLVDLNRSEGHPGLFSRYTAGLSPEERERVLARYYRPYRERVEGLVRERVRAGTVLHVSVHSFAPVVKGVRREVDLGLLYDPGREGERRLCAGWALLLREALPEYRVLRNSPYRGTADGLTTYLRRRFPGGKYLGIEVELGQGRMRGGKVEGRVVELLSGLLEGSLRGVGAGRGSLP